MQNRINKIIDVCIQNDFTEIKIKERRTYFVDIICQNILKPNKIKVKFTMHTRELLYMTNEQTLSRLRYLTV